MKAGSRPRRAAAAIMRVGLGAGVSFGPATDRWSISAFVRTIENDRLLTAPIAFGGALFAYTSAPRTYGARASIRF